MILKNMETNVTEKVKNDSLWEVGLSGGKRWNY